MVFVNIYADNRPETIRSLILWAACILFLGYQAFNVFVPNSELIIYARILDTSATAAALWLFAADAWAGVFASRPKPRDFLIVGIWLKFLSAEMQSVYAILYRLGGQPPWWLNNELLGPTILLSVVAAVLHICTPGTVEGVVPRRNQYALAIGFAVGVLLVGVLIASKPDVLPWLDAVRPYLGDWWQTGRILGTEPA